MDNPLAGRFSVNSGMSVETKIGLLISLTICVFANKDVVNINIHNAINTLTL